MKLHNLVLVLGFIAFNAYGASSEEEIYSHSVNTITVPAEISGGFMSKVKELDINKTRKNCEQYAKMFNKKCGEVVGFEDRFHDIYITYEFLDRE